MGRSTRAAWRERVQREQEPIQGIAEYLQREHPEKTVCDLWPEALSIFRVQFEPRVLPPPEEEPATVTHVPENSPRSTRTSSSSS